MRVLFCVPIQLLTLLIGFCLPATASSNAPPAPLDPHNVKASSLDGPLDLSSIWLLKQGDDPGYADPKLDDSRWMVVSAGRALSTYGLRDVNFVWYRTHVHIPPGSRNLALLLRYFVGSEQIFVNGLQIGSSDTAPSGGSPRLNLADRVSLIPDALLASGDLTIAVRAQIGRASVRGTGGFATGTKLMLGPAPLLAEEASLLIFEYFTSEATNLLLELPILLIALALALTLRTEREYLFLALYLAAVGYQGASQVWAQSRNVEYTVTFTLIHTLVNTASIVALLEFVRLVLGLRRSWVIKSYEWLQACWLPFGFWLNYNFVMGEVSAASTHLQRVAWWISPVLNSPLEAGLPIVAIWVWRKRRNPDALILFVPLFCKAALIYYNFASWALAKLGFIDASRTLDKLSDYLPMRFFFVTWFDVWKFFFSVALMLFLVLRTLSVARVRARIESEIKAAGTVQQVLLARASEPTPGFAVESVYHPAAEVGGDFFLVLPGADRSLTAIVGDVSGKGLAAAMRVSMILGVLSGEDAWEPVAILTRLNQALLAQSEMGFTTACCVRLEQSGHYTLANAGHIPPYTDGIEIETPPGLPLGLVPQPGYESVSGLIREGETMVLMSDGVVEARSAKGELYGFERLPELTRLPAVEIAGTAQRFGQEDDITVLTIACSCV